MVELFGKKFFYRGDLRLLDRRKVSIVGTRRPLAYSKQMTHSLASGFARLGWAVASGGAMGIDAVAHRGAGAANTILVLPCGIDHLYPKVNAKLIEEVARKGLVLSQFEKDFRATQWSFVVRNESVVRLGEFLIVSEAAPGSGSMRSVEYAKKYGKKIYVLPHRIGESEGTNQLAKRQEASLIWDVEEFLKEFGHEAFDQEIRYLQSAPFYEDALEYLGDRLVELELTGAVEIVGGRVYIKEVG